MGKDDFRALWFNASEKEGYTSISEGRTILISLGKLRFIDQRCQLGLKSTLCGECCTMPFYQRLSCDFIYQAPPLFSRALKRSGRLGTRLAMVHDWFILHMIYQNAHNVLCMSAATLDHFTVLKVMWFLFLVSSPDPTHIATRGRGSREKRQHSWFRGRNLGVPIRSQHL